MFRKGFLDTSEFDICNTLESKMGLDIKLILADMAILFHIVSLQPRRNIGQTVRICTYMHIFRFWISQTRLYPAYLMTAALI